MLKTSLYDEHLLQNAKMVEFFGWSMPIQYKGILQEHSMVRSSAGLFDVSHMGEIMVQGKDAEDFLMSLLTNNIKSLIPGQTLYTFMCYDDGGVVDDLIVYKYSDEKYLLVVNAANTEKDFSWIREHLNGEVTAENVSDNYAQLAIQGPKAVEILSKLTDADIQAMGYFSFEDPVMVDGVPCLVSRTGYTGEDGFEIYMSPEFAPKIWNSILDAGKDEICPVGLGARDTLRFEAKLPLYGQEFSETISPIEAGFGFFVKIDDRDFIGKNALAIQKSDGTKRKLVEFEMVDKGIARSHYEIESKDGKIIGYVTSGGFAPTLNKNIGLGLIQSEHANVGDHIDILVRNRKLDAVIIKNGFYKRNRK